MEVDDGAATSIQWNGGEIPAKRILRLVASALHPSPAVDASWRRAGCWGCRNATKSSFAAFRSCDALGQEGIDSLRLLRRRLTVAAVCRLNTRKSEEQPNACVSYCQKRNERLAAPSALPPSSAFSNSAFVRPGFNAFGSTSVAMIVIT